MKTENIFLFSVKVDLLLSQVLDIYLLTNHCNFKALINIEIDSESNRLHTFDCYDRGTQTRCRAELCHVGSSYFDSGARSDSVKLLPCLAILMWR